MDAFNTKTQETETGESWIQRQEGIYGENLLKVKNEERKQ